MFKLIVIVLICAVLISRYLDYPTSLNDGSQFVHRPKETYDYIIVGAGSAGSVLASRLSEDAHVTVLLVEAGGDDRGIPEISTPGLTLALDTIPDVVTTYYTEPMKTKWPRGRALGGSSSINYMNYVRGSKHDFDRWANYTKDPSWDYAHVLPYFKKSEKMTDPELKQSEFHGGNGQLGVTKMEASSSFSSSILAGFQDLGFIYNEDYNGRTMNGVGKAQTTIENGIRSSTARAFLHPILNRPNLDIMVNAFVQKVVIKDKHAEGVEVIFQNKKYVVKSNKEIILSAGAIQSPQILMLSGVGPKKHLEELGIPVVVDLPVGQNLQDHVYSALEFHIKDVAVPSFPSLRQWLSHLQYKFFHTGQLSSLGIDVMAFTSVSEEMKQMGWPEIQFIIAPICLTSIDVSNCWTCVPYSTRPASRGYIQLKSKDPFDDPLLVPNYFHQKVDAELNYEGLKICQKLSQTKSLKSMGTPSYHNVGDICKQYPFDSQEFWNCFIRSRPDTVFHPTGTCKMGFSGDPSAVLDSKLRVIGIKALRVVDASVMPFLVSGNTNAATIMIAEQASDFIKNQS
nr:glucose dehydrogenase FAD; quinone-like [Biomphalaria glabrata]